MRQRCQAAISRFWWEFYVIIRKFVLRRLPYRAVPCCGRCFSVHCRAAPCPVVPCSAVPCSAVSCRVLLCYVMPYCVLPCHVLLCPAMPCHVLPYHALPCHVMSCRTVPCRTVSCPMSVMPVTYWFDLYVINCVVVNWWDFAAFLLVPDEGYVNASRNIDNLYTFCKYLCSNGLWRRLLSCPVPGFARFSSWPGWPWMDFPPLTALCRHGGRKWCCRRAVAIWDGDAWLWYAGEGGKRS